MRLSASVCTFTSLTGATSAVKPLSFSLAFDTVFAKPIQRFPFAPVGFAQPDSFSTCFIAVHSASNGSDHGSFHAELTDMNENPSPARYFSRQYGTGSTTWPLSFTCGYMSAHV